MDGVIAMRPRIFKLNHSRGKYRINLSVFEQWFWTAVMAVRSPSQILVAKILKFKKGGDKLYLVTGRLAFLEKMTWWWLRKHNLTEMFDQVLINTGNIQPHEFKARQIIENKIDQFYEDELFTAKYLRKMTKADINLVINNGENIEGL